MIAEHNDEFLPHNFIFCKTTWHFGSQHILQQQVQTHHPKGSVPISILDSTVPFSSLYESIRFPMSQSHLNPATKYLKVSVHLIITQAKKKYSISQFTDLHSDCSGEWSRSCYISLTLSRCEYRWTKITISTADSLTKITISTVDSKSFQPLASRRTSFQ